MRGVFQFFTCDSELRACLFVCLFRANFSLLILDFSLNCQGTGQLSLPAAFSHSLLLGTVICCCVTGYLPVEVTGHTSCFLFLLGHHRVLSTRVIDLPVHPTPFVWDSSAQGGVGGYSSVEAPL